MSLRDQLGGGPVTVVPDRLVAIPVDGLLNIAREFRRRSGAWPALFADEDVRAARRGLAWLSVLFQRVRDTRLTRHVLRLT
jgi:hypothetical protein